MILHISQRKVNSDDEQSIAKQHRKQGRLVGNACIAICSVDEEKGRCGSQKGSQRAFFFFFFFYRERLKSLSPE